MVDRTKLRNGQILYLYRAPREHPATIRPFVDEGHVPDIAGSEVDLEGSPMRGIVVGILLSLPLWLLIALLWRRFA
jgi:hypothetical protein